MRVDVGAAHVHICVRTCALICLKASESCVSLSVNRFVLRDHLCVGEVEVKGNIHASNEQLKKSTKNTTRMNHPKGK